MEICEGYWDGAPDSLLCFSMVLHYCNLVVIWVSLT